MWDCTPVAPNGSGDHHPEPDNPLPGTKALEELKRIGDLCRANPAHLRQLRPNYGSGVQVEVLTFVISSPVFAWQRNLVQERKGLLADLAPFPPRPPAPSNAFESILRFIVVTLEAGVE